MRRPVRASSTIRAAHALARKQRTRIASLMRARGCPVTRRARRALTRAASAAARGVAAAAARGGWLCMGKQYYMCITRATPTGGARRRRRDGDGDDGSMCVIFSGLDAPGACGCAIRCARWAMAVRAFFTSWAPPASTLALVRTPARTCAVDCRRALDTVRDTHSIVGTVR